MTEIVRLKDLTELDQLVKDLTRQYLERFGWTCTCNTPGAYWLWRRDFADVDARNKAWHDAHPTASPHEPYGVITAATDTAVAMTSECLDRDSLEDR